MIYSGISLGSDLNMKVIKYLSLIVTFVAVGTFAHAQVKKASDIDKRLAKVALRFYLAEAPNNACGKDCSRWVAVEGEFDKGSAERLANFIRENNLSEFPIFFNSTGGLADEGMALGRHLRSLGMRAGVARTQRVCKVAEVSCSPDPKSSSPEPASASWRSEAAKCNSACVYALIGATQRWVPIGSSVGVHSPAYFCFSDKTGQVVRPVGASEDAVDCKKKIGERERDLKRFLVEMGITPELHSLINQVPNSRMRYLTRDELKKYQISTGEFRKS